MTARVVLIKGAVAREREISFGSLSVKSAIGTFRTWRNVRLESVMRCTADIDRALSASPFCILE
jgi:hypothetical protein